MTDQTTIADEPQNELQASVDTVQREIAAFNRIEAGIAAIAEKHPADLVLDVKTPAGMKEAIAGRAAWRDTRIAVESVRKAAKAPVLDLGKRIDGFAKSLTERLQLGESNYDDQIKVEQERKEAEKRAAAEAEAARVQRIRDRIATCFTSRAARMFAAGPTAISMALDEVVTSNMIEEHYGEFLPDALAAQEKAAGELRGLYEAAKAKELEQVRQRELAEENARQAQKLADERAVFEKQQAAAKAEQDARDRAAREAQALADANAERDRQARAAELEKIEQAKQELAAKERAEADRVAAIERKRLDDEAAAERAERKRREEEEAAERAKQFAEERRLADEKIAAERAASEKKRKAEAKAAAKLAAAQKAGPRLLVALKAMLADAWDGDPKRQASDPLCVEAAAAIAEAEGDAS